MNLMPPPRIFQPTLKERRLNNYFETSLTRIDNYTEDVNEFHTLIYCGEHGVGKTTILKKFEDICNKKWKEYTSSFPVLLSLQEKSDVIDILKSISKKLEVSGYFDFERFNESLKYIDCTSIKADFLEKITVVWLDNIIPTKFPDIVYPVIILDSYEAIRNTPVIVSSQNILNKTVDEWFKRIFLPLCWKKVPNFLLIITDQADKKEDWEKALKQDTFKGIFYKTIAVENFTRQEVNEYLKKCGIKNRKNILNKINEITNGNPLFLSLLIDMLKRHEKPHEIINQILDDPEKEFIKEPIIKFITGIKDHSLNIGLESCAVPLRIDKEMFTTLLSERDLQKNTIEKIWERLCALPLFDMICEDESIYKLRSIARDHILKSLKESDRIQFQKLNKLVSNIIEERIINIIKKNDWIFKNMNLSAIIEEPQYLFEIIRDLKNVDNFLIEWFHYKFWAGEEEGFELFKKLFIMDDYDQKGFCKRLFNEIEVCPDFLEESIKKWLTYYEICIFSYEKVDINYAKENLLNLMEADSDEILKTHIVIHIAELNLKEAKWQDSKIEYEKAYDLVQKNGDQIAENELLMIQGKIYRGLGKCERELGNLNKAIEYYEKAIGFFNRIGSNYLVIKSLVDQSAAYKDKGNFGNFTEAGAKLDEVILFVKKPSYLYAEILSERADIFRRVGKWNISKDLLEEAKEFFKKINANIELAKVTYRLGNYFLHRGNIKDAINNYYKALEYIPEKDHKYRGIIYSHLGGAYRKKNLFEEAFNCYKKAWNIFKNPEQEIFYDMALCLWGLGMVFHKRYRKSRIQKDINHAIDRYMYSLEIFKQNSPENFYRMAQFLNSLSRAFIYMDLNKAEDYLKKSIKLCEKVDNHYQMSEIKLTNSMLNYIRGKKLRKNQIDFFKKAFSEATEGIDLIKNKGIEDDEILSQFYLIKGKAAYYIKAEKRESAEILVQALKYADWFNSILGEDILGEIGDFIRWIASPKDEVNKDHVMELCDFLIQYGEILDKREDIKRFRKLFEETKEYFKNEYFNDSEFIPFLPPRDYMILIYKNSLLKKEDVIAEA